MASISGLMARVFHKKLSAGAYPYAAWKPVKKFEADLLLQILNLSRERRLGDPKPLRGATVMLLLSDRYEIAQMPQLHTDTA